MENQVIDIYQDGKFDINFLDDLLSLDLDAEGQINILGKDNRNISFRLGSDFFQFDYTTKDLLHFPDYKSLFENSNSKLVFSENQSFENNDYGKVIVDSLDIINIKSRKNKKLDERSEFIVNKPQLSLASPEKRLQLKDKLSNEIKKTLPQQELKPVTDLFDVVLMVAVMAFLFKLKFNKSKENDELVNEIIKGLDDNTLSIDSLYKDKYLNEKIPELRDVLDLYKKNHFVEFKLMVGSDEVSSTTVINNNPLLLGNEVRKANLFLENNFQEKLKIGYNPQFAKNSDLGKMFPDIGNSKELKQASDFINNDKDYKKYFNISEKEVGVTGLLMASLFSNYNGNKEMEKFCLNKAFQTSLVNNVEMGKVFKLFDSIKSQISLGTILKQDSSENEKSMSNPISLKR